MSTLVRRRDALGGLLAALATASWPDRADAVGRTAAATAPIGSAQLEALIRTRLQPLLDRLQVPGLAVSIMHGDREAAFGMGHASLPFQVAATPRTLFHVGSVGKHATALAVAALEIEGRLKPDDPIGRHLDDLPPAWQTRTVDSLLHHRSGLPDYISESFDETKPHTRAEIVASAAATPVLFDADTAWSYSNTNYMLLGWLVEHASGAPFAQYLTERVLRRAGLVDARVDAAEEIVPQRAEPYVWDRRGKSWRHAPRMQNEFSGYPDGPVLMSAADGVQWQRALTENRVVAATARSRMLAPGRFTTGRVAPYGCGMFVGETRGRPIEWHTGSVPGYSAYLFRAPTLGLGVLVASNADFGSSRVQRHVGKLVAETALPGSTVLSLEAASDDRPDLTAAARKLLLRGDAPVDRSLLAPELRVLVEGPLGDAGVQRLGKGDADGFVFLEQRRVGDALLRRYRTSHPDVVEHVTVGFTPEGRIYWAIPE